MDAGVRGLQQRIESSRAGQVVISVFLALLLGTLIITTGQPSALQRETADLASPGLVALGLEQSWGVFAPDPRPISIEFFARVRYADGTRETWRIPEGSPLVGEYWDYRWRKYLEYLVQEPFLGLTVKPMSEFIAREAHKDGRVPTRVVLVRRIQAIRSPGSDPPRGPVTEQAYFVLKVDEKVLES
jgi:hypothetical protein